MVASLNASESLTRDIREALIGYRSGSLQIEDVHVSVVDDVADEPAFRAVVYLPVPASGAWDPQEAFVLRRHVRAEVDTAAQRHGLDVQGLTSVQISANGVSEADIALDSEPEADEVAGPGSTEGQFG